MKNSRRTRSTTRLGCGFLVGLGALVSLLFLANLMFVKAFMNANLPGIDFRISQAAYSILPVLFIFVEFWVFDLIVAGRYRKGE